MNRTFSRVLRSTVQLTAALAAGIPTLSYTTGLSAATTSEIALGVGLLGVVATFMMNALENSNLPFPTLFPSASAPAASGTVVTLSGDLQKLEAWLAEMASAVASVKSTLGAAPIGQVAPATAPVPAPAPAPTTS